MSPQTRAASRKRKLETRDSDPRKRKLQTCDSDLEYHEELLSTADNGINVYEIKTTPLFSASVLEALFEYAKPSGYGRILPQYSLIAKVLDDHEAKPSPDTPFRAIPGTRLFLNTNAPWSAFTCGDEGSDKSHTHTPSCVSEYTIPLAPTVAPPAGMLFHYDKFTGVSNSDICQAAYLCSSGIPVKILVCQDVLPRMKAVYENLSGVPKDRQPEVMPFLITEAQLSIAGMMKLMAAEEKRSKSYMTQVECILKSMSLNNLGQSGLDYSEFKRRIELEPLTNRQYTLIHKRLGLLDKVIYRPKGRSGGPTGFACSPGSLTIVDLSLSPLIDECCACSFSDVSIGLFLDSRHTSSPPSTSPSNTASQMPASILAVNEAQNFMNKSSPAIALRETLHNVVCSERHLGTRTIITTQKPTINSVLLDSCSMTIVHRLTSPKPWLKELKKHIAGAACDYKGSKEIIEGFKAGEGLIYCIQAMVDAECESGLKGENLGAGALKVRIR